MVPYVAPVIFWVNCSALENIHHRVLHLRGVISIVGVISCVLYGIGAIGQRYFRSPPHS